MDHIPGHSTCSPETAHGVIEYILNGNILFIKYLFLYGWTCANMTKTRLQFLKSKQTGKEEEKLYRTFDLYCGRKRRQPKMIEIVHQPCKKTRNRSYY